MADIAWIELKRYERITDLVQTIALNEDSISYFEAWVETIPGDPRTRAGVKTVIYLRDGSQIFVLETYTVIAGLVKIKIP